jgi:glycosyltransferase involved in cell wall biosynthesis
MRIAMIAPGTGLPYYCENCTRDPGVVRALSERGHQVSCGSLYLPPAGGNDGRSEPVFYGALNLVLGQVLPAYRSAPGWLRRALDGKPLLRLAASLSSAADADAMAALTLSVLRGEEGSQAIELDQLIRWLRGVRPDVLYLSNCLLIGVARRAQTELGIPVVCALQDEDTWIDAMSAAQRAAAWTILRERAARVDGFLPVSEYYGALIVERLGIPPGRMRVVQPGIDLHGFPAVPPLLNHDPPVVGFLSRFSNAMGLDILCEAFVRLCADGRFPGLRLRLAGGGTPADFRLLHGLSNTLARRGLGGRLDVVHSFGRAERIEFLRSISVLSVPVRQGEAFGTFMLEAMAAGVPVVQPRLGGFPEVVCSTGGGILYGPPNTSEALAKALASLLSDHDRARKLGAAGFQAVRDRFTSSRMAERLEHALEDIVGRKGCGQ